jgi:hypothetical protein
MKVQLVKPDLHQIDHLNVDTFAITVFEDQRPPKGLAGLVDWRLCGRMSNLLISGQLTGRFREAVMFPGYGRLPSGRVLVFGLGDSRDFSQSRAREASWFMADSLRRLRTAAFVTSLPGSTAGTVAPKVGMELFIEEITRVFGSEESGSSLEVHVVEPQEYHRELNEMVASATRRLRGMWK